MSTLLVYLVLFNFWLEASLHFELEKLFGLSMGMSLKNIGLYLLLLSSVFAFKSQKSFFFKNNVNFYIILLSFVILISILIEIIFYNENSEFEVLKSQIVFFKNFINPWIFFILLSIIIKSKKTCKNALLGIMLLVFFTAMTGIIEQNTTLNFGAQNHIKAYEGRYFAFGEASQYAAFLVLTLPLVFSYSIYNRSVKKKILYSIIFLAGFIGLISTVSRGGYIGFIFATFVFIIISLKQRVITIYKVTTIFAIILPVFIFGTYITLSYDVKEAIKRKVVGQMSTKYSESIWEKEKPIYEVYTSGRTQRWIKAINLFFESPILGKGNYTVKNVLRFDPHNDYLNILIKYGLVGFLVYVMIYASILTKIIKKLKNYNDEEDKKFIYIAYISGFIGYMVCMFGIQLVEPRYIFWIYTAIIIKYIYLDSKDEETSKSERSKVSSFI